MHRSCCLLTGFILCLSTRLLSLCSANVPKGATPRRKEVRQWNLLRCVDVCLCLLSSESQRSNPAPDNSQDGRSIVVWLAKSLCNPDCAVFVELTGIGKLGVLVSFSNALMGREICRNQLFMACQQTCYASTSYILGYSTIHLIKCL